MLRPRYVVGILLFFLCCCVAFRWNVRRIGRCNAHSTVRTSSAESERGPLHISSLPLTLLSPVLTILRLREYTDRCDLRRVLQTPLLRRSAARQRTRRRTARTLRHTPRGRSKRLPSPLRPSLTRLPPSSLVIGRTPSWAIFSASCRTSSSLPSPPTRTCTPQPRARLLGGRRHLRRCGFSYPCTSTWASLSSRASTCTGRVSSDSRTSSPPSLGIVS